MFNLSVGLKRFSSPFVKVSAIYLIVFDLAMFFMQQEITVEGVFDTVLTYFIPCGILTGAAVLCYLGESKAKTPFAVLAAVFAAVMGVIRLFALVMQAVLISNGEGATGTQEYFEIAKFIGDIFIITAMFFLMLRIIKGVFKKLTLSFSLIAVITFAVYYVADIVFTVISMNNSGQKGILIFITECLTTKFVMGLLLTVAYLIIFSVLAGVFEKTEKETN